MRHNDAFVARIANTRLMKTFVAIFALPEKLPTSAILSQLPPKLSKKLQRLSHLFSDRIKFHAKKIFPNVAADRMFPWMKIFVRVWEGVKKGGGPKSQTF